MSKPRLFAAAGLLACGLTLAPGALVAETAFGFSSWPYAPTTEAVAETYRFLRAEGDIISEQLDDKLPWRAFLKGETPPKAAREDLEGRRARLAAGTGKRLVSVTPFNTGRDGLAPGYEGGAPWTSRLGNADWAEAYARYCLWVIDRLEPDYFILGIEVNEFRANKPGKWADYTGFAQKVRAAIRAEYPDLPLSESVSLHNLLDEGSQNRQAIRADVKAHLSGLDLTTVSYYPFMRGTSDRAGFDAALNWVRDWAPAPVAISETGFPAEPLVLPSWQVDLPLSPADQSRYMRALIDHAQSDDYPFAIWWTHRDFDALWQDFPASVKELGKIWRDTGLLDENGVARPALTLWRRNR